MLDFTQHGLAQEQLPRVLKTLIDDGAKIVAVYIESRSLFDRYAVAYFHVREIEFEVFT